MISNRAVTVTAAQAVATHGGRPSYYRLEDSEKQLETGYHVVSLYGRAAGAAAAILPGCDSRLALLVTDTVTEFDSDRLRERFEEPWAPGPGTGTAESSAPGDAGRP